MPNVAKNTEPNDWVVRQVEHSPSLVLEGFKMYRVLDDSGFEGVGCEFVVIGAGKILEPHIHKKGHAIILVISGVGHALIAGVRYPIGKNTVINIPPGTEHGLEAGAQELVVYGFQVPAIIDEHNNADIYFTKGNRKGEVEEVYAGNYPAEAHANCDHANT